MNKAPATEICAYCPRSLLLDHERYRGWHDGCSPRTRPLVQFVISAEEVSQSTVFHVNRSVAGSKPSHWLIQKPEYVGFANTLELARRHVPVGYRRLPRRKDDPGNLVEVWV